MKAAYKARSSGAMMMKTSATSTQPKVSLNHLKPAGNAYLLLTYSQAAVFLLFFLILLQVLH